MIFNSVTQRSALNIIQSLKQSKKKKRLSKKPVEDLNILFISSKSIKQWSEWFCKNAAVIKSLIESSNSSESDLNDSLLDSVTIEAQKLTWVKSVVNYMTSELNNRLNYTLIKTLLAEQNKKLLAKDLADWDI